MHLAEKGIISSCSLEIKEKGSGVGGGGVGGRLCERKKLAGVRRRARYWMMNSKVGRFTIVRLFRWGEK